MDIYCPTCTEPIDHDELHTVAEELGSTYAAVSADFRKRGCKALAPVYSAAHCTPGNAGTANMIAEVYGLLGDDMDGAASLLDDAQSMGLL